MYMESSDYYQDAGYHDNRHGPYMGDDSIETNERASGTTHHSPITLHQSPLTNLPLAADKVLSAGMIDTYYIWSYDGRLMAEYDQNGNCVKDYIYLGNRMLAEYHPATGKYYYHSQDQVGTTRIVTDDVGNVVYSAVHGPYGDIQKEWISTYKPAQKFSGKEREAYSDMDYFGARYFDHISYRFVSVDPVRNRDEALADPQLWNLYSYCRNNPIRYLDPDGNSHVEPSDWAVYRTLYNDVSPEFANSYLKQQALGYTELIAGEVIGAGLAAGVAKGIKLLKNVKWIKRIFTSSKAFEIAEAGGKHSGQLKTFLEMTKNQLEKSIISFERNISKHKSWIKNPSAKIANWGNLTSQYQSSIIHHWSKDIERAKELKSIATQIFVNK